MKRLFVPVAVLALALAGCSSATKCESCCAADETGFEPLFNGKDLTGWKATNSEKAGNCFGVVDGAIQAHCGPSHLFYVGSTHNHDWKNFHVKLEVMTTPGSNGGFYFHTRPSDSVWPDTGFEVQVNATHKDPKKGASLYAIVNLMEPPAPDGVWYTQEIIVEGNHVRSIVNGKTVVDYTQPEGGDPDRPKGMAGRVIDHGTFAIQGHDPKSVTYYRNIRVKPLP
jgi:hypothetical protein